MSKHDLQRPSGAAAALGFPGRIRFDSAEELADLTYDDVAAGYVVGAGGSSYLVLEEGATKAHLDFTGAGGVKLHMIPGEGTFTASQAGARAGMDATAALQAVIDASMYGGPSNASLNAGVKLDLGRLVTSDTIHIGYGDAFKGGVVSGMGMVYAGNSEPHVGTVIESLVTDRPAVNIQGARNSRISDLTIMGPARSAILAILSGPFTRSLCDPATWDAALAAAGVRAGKRYAPHIGLAVDAYSGPRPAEPYPDVAYPDFLPGLEQYDKSRSSYVTAQSVEIQGFEVGMCVRPGDINKNGDFIKTLQSRLNFCKFGFSIGNNQGRVTDLSQSEFSFNWTCITNNEHGPRQGRFDSTLLNGHAGGFAYQLVKLAAGSVGGQLVLQNFYAESLWRIGEILGNNSAPSIALAIRNSLLNFRNMADESNPGWLVDMGNDADVLVIEETTLAPTRVAALGQGRVMQHLNECRPLVPPAKPYEAAAMNALSGGLVAGRLMRRPFVARMKVYDVDTAQLADEGITDGTYAHTGRQYCIPHACQAGLNRVAGTFSGKPLPFFSLAPNTRSSITRTGRAVRFVTSLVDPDPARMDVNYERNLLPGCVMLDPDTGTVMFIRSVDNATRTIIAEMQNNYWKDSRTGLYETSFNPALGAWTCILALVYTPDYMLTGTFTEGSNVITNLRTPVGALPADPGLQVGDRLATAYYLDPPVTGSAGRKITGIDTEAGTITLRGNALWSGRIPLPFWYRTPPANAASR